MTTFTPAPVRHHLTRAHTDVRRGKARIEQAFDARLGWHDVDMPATVGAVRLLAQRGQTSVAVGYNRPGYGRTVADFTVRECLSGLVAPETLHTWATAWV